MRIALFHNLPSGGAKRAVFEFIKHLSKAHEIDLYIYDIKAEDFLDIVTTFEHEFYDAKEFKQGAELMLEAVGTANEMFSALWGGRVSGDLETGLKSDNILDYLTVPSSYLGVQEQFHRRFVHMEVDKDQVMMDRKTPVARELRKYYFDINTLPYCLEINP